MEKLLFENIPFNGNIFVFENIACNLVEQGKWFLLNGERITSSGELKEEGSYTFDREEYDWYIRFCNSYEWVKDHQEEIREAFFNELKYGDVSTLFDEINDYVDRIDYIKRRVLENR